MFTLLGCNFHYDDDAPSITPVAEFDNKEKLMAYIEAVTLETFPNGNRRFRRDSLLGGYSYYDYEVKPSALPVNPASPDCPPSVEYIVVVPDGPYGRGIRILCRTKIEAEKELAGFYYKETAVKGGYIEERQV